MPKLLLIHHLEPCWENGYRRYGTSFECLQEKIVDYLKPRRRAYKSVIVTRFEDDTIKEEQGYYPELVAKVNKVYNYEYGWERVHLESNPECFVEGGNHSQAVYVPDWLRDISLFNATVGVKNKNKTITIDLCGAFRGECLEDISIALDAVNIKYGLIEELCVG